MYYKSILLTIVMMSMSQVEANYKKVILISTPRSLSTVFLRMMEARGDFKVFNEPGMAAFHRQKHQTKPLESVFSLQAPSTYAEVYDILNTELKNSNVFIKEMHFAAKAYLTDESFISSPECFVIFLVRNPHHAAISNFKKLCTATGNAEKVWYVKREFPDYMSYASLYELYDEIQRKSMHKPYVILAEELAQNPEQVLTDMCAYLDIPMKQECLTWNKLDTTFSTQEHWHDSKHSKGSWIWHDRAMQSDSFGTLPSYAVDAKGEPTFEEIKDPELRGAHKWEYLNNLMYYKKFCDIVQEQKAKP